MPEPVRSLRAQIMKKDRAALLRIFSLGGFFAFMAWTTYMHQAQGGGSSGFPPVDALCPLGGLETLHRWLSNGEFLRRVAPSAIVLFVAVGAMTLLLGRVFCGWVCPLGAIGEFCGFVGRKLRLPRISLPDRTDRVLKFLKYGVLIAILWGTVKFGTLVWRDYDPWVAWSHIGAGWGGAAERPWAWAVFLGAVVGAGLFVERFWCRYLCPLGAALGILGKVSPLRVGNSGGCNDCGLCRKACPVQLHPEKGNVSGAECLSCGRCVSAAPSKCDVRFRWMGRSVRVLSVGIAALVLFFGSYTAARAMGYWTTFIPPKITANMAPDRVAESIFGWMSLKQVSELTGIPLDTIRRRAELGDVSATESMKALGIDDNKVREAVREIVKGWKTAPAAAPAASSTPPDPAEIRGTATLLDLKAIWGLEPSAILKEAGWPEDLPYDVPLRDLKTRTGREVEEIRAAVKRLR